MVNDYLLLIHSVRNFTRISLCGISLRNNHGPEPMTEQFNALLTTFNINNSRQSIDLSKHEENFENSKN